MSVDFFRSTLAETSALHHRVKEADPKPVLDAAAIVDALGGGGKLLLFGSDVTARVQEVHRTLLHVICDIVEKSVVGRA